jgi:alpha-methylacyl-CoA racemase
LRVVEIGGIGPSPFAGMLLADLGADVVHIERPGGPGDFALAHADGTLNRGKRRVELDLRAPTDLDRALLLIARADAATEGFRPGVAERLGIGPDDCHRRNRRLVYGRMTGWGQEGPLAARAGHDINYISLTGALHAIGAPDGPPQVPLNLVGDFGGGGMYLVVGVLAGLRAAAATGRGEVVDASILDGTAHMLAATHALMNAGAWDDRRGANLLDGGAPFYTTYETADHRHMAVGAIEPQFFARLIQALGLQVDPRSQLDRETWPATRRAIAKAFKRRTQGEWTDIFERLDACVSPVLTLLEAADHPHVRSRQTVVWQDGGLQPTPAPRFSGARPEVSPLAPTTSVEDVLSEWTTDNSGG